MGYGSDGIRLYRLKRGSHDFGDWKRRRRAVSCRMCDGVRSKADETNAVAGFDVGDMSGKITSTSQKLSYEDDLYGVKVRN